MICNLGDPMSLGHPVKMHIETIYNFDIRAFDELTNRMSKSYIVSIKTYGCMFQRSFQWKRSLTIYDSTWVHSTNAFIEKRLISSLKRDLYLHWKETYISNAPMNALTTWVHSMNFRCTYAFHWNETYISNAPMNALTTWVHSMNFRCTYAFHWKETYIFI